MRQKSKNEAGGILKLLVLLFVVLIVIIVVIVILQKNNKSNDSNIGETKVITPEEEKEIRDSAKISDLAEMEERQRMEFYFSEFIEAIELGKYEDAYDMLYDDFKQNYFPTYNDFEKYAIEKFPKFIGIEHTNFERNGTVYVMWITMTDTINGSKDSGIELNVVIQEKDLNDFKLSFSVF